MGQEAANTGTQAASGTQATSGLQASAAATTDASNSQLLSLLMG